MSKPGKVLKGLCKRLGVRLTIKRGKKRVYKSVKVLKTQCANKKKKHKVKRKKKKVLKKRKFGTKSDNIKNDWLAPGQIPTDIKVVVKCPPKNIKFYIHYRKKKLSDIEEENMSTIWIDEPIVFSGTVSDCRMDQYSVILRFKITECPDRPILVGDIVTIYSERDQISLFPIGKFLSRQRLYQYYKGFKKMYDKKSQKKKYIGIKTKRYETMLRENNELFLDKIEMAEKTTDETRLKIQSIKFHPFLTKSEKEYILEEISRNYPLYDSGTPSMRMTFFTRILNDLLEFKKRKDAIKYWVINRNIDDNYKNELYDWFLIYEKDRKEKFIENLKKFFKNNNPKIKITNLSNWNMNKVFGNNPQLFDDNFKEFNLSKIICKNCRWNGLNLIGANLKGANLERTQFYQVKLQNTNLENTNLQRARFHSSKLIGTNLKDANLTKANFQKTNLSRANLTQANLYQALFLSGNDLSYTNLENATLSRAVLLEANLTQANLKDAVLYKSKLRKVILKGANLEEANLKEANLKGADLRGANLTRAKLEGTILKDAIYNDNSVTLDGKQYGKTKFPQGFDKESRGMIKNNSSSFGKKRKRKKVKRKHKPVKRKRKTVKRKRKKK